MSGSFAVYGILFLVSSAVGGLADVRIDRGRDDKKEPEKKPNIVRDYVCLRDGELCHPNFAMNRGLFVSCSNGVAWEQQCPKCSYHPLSCPTKTLWFDGDKCGWASPKLASQSCIDRLPLYDTHNGTTKEATSSSFNAAGEQNYPVPNLISVPGGPMASYEAMNNAMKEQHQIPAEKGKWPGINSPSPQPPPIYFKSPKAEEEQSEEKILNEKPESSKKLSRTKSAAEASELELEQVENDSDAESPAYYSPEENMIGSKIIRLSEPVYALVDAPEGEGKQVLVKVAQPFVFEDAARSLLPELNSISPYTGKE